MHLSSGTRVGNFELRECLGAGGMGVVYRARDTRLNRDVALKFLPEQFLSDPDRLARFQREAQVLASLNHPNIATIHGLEESGTTRALVMELVEGPTLGERMEQGPMPADEVIAIARQMAEALEYAHERGIIHRDLKPANVKLTADGHVKLLDFGLAKALSDEATLTSQSNSPTLSLAATQAGVILGTAAYMSPEQAKGKPVDRRADIWAFGVIVFEMLAGKPLFAGETVSETMAYVMTRDPEWTALPPATPSRLRQLLQRCLTRDSRNRLRDIGEARVALDDSLARPEEPANIPQTQPVAPRTFLLRSLPWVAAAAAALTAAVSLWAPWTSSPEARPLVRLTANLGVDADLFTDFGPSAVLSPDGRTLVFVAMAPGSNARELFIRRLDQLQATALNGTEGARTPFFSPDGQWIGFFAGGKLKKVSVSSGAAVDVTAASDERGGTWAEDGSMIWSTGGPGSVLRRVSSSGGAVEPITTLDQAARETNHRLPQALPGGRGVLFTVSSTNEASIAVQSFSNEPKKILRRGATFGRYLPSGHLVYVQDATLFAAAFDIDRLEITTEPIPVIEGVADSGFGGAHFSVANDGSLLYLPVSAVGTSMRGQAIHWLGASGKTEPMQATPHNYGSLRFSPDGSRLLLDFSGGPSSSYDVWIYEWMRGVMSPLTADAAEDRNAIWSPDGRYVAYASARSDGVTRNVYAQRSDGTGGVYRLTESNGNQLPTSWHPSGKFLAFFGTGPQAGADIFILPIEGHESSALKPGQPAAFVEDRGAQREATFSPDGNWVAYESNESGRDEIYVRPFPGPGGKTQISTEGGRDATWAANGKELFYGGLDQKIRRVSYTTDKDAFHPDKPRVWSEISFASSTSPARRNFDLHPDGRRFAILQGLPSADTKADHLVFVLNFSDELRRLVSRSQP